MSKLSFMPVFVTAVAVAGSALGQTTAGAAPAASPPPAATQKTDQPPTVDRLAQDLQKAGFTDVKVLPDSFLVQAKTADGHAILMTIGPQGMSAMEVIAEKAPATTAQQAGKRADANLTFDTSPSDHARIREIFSKEPAAAKVDHVGFSLAAGTVVPHSVHLTALPRTIVDIQPTWRGDEYFQVGDKIVIVDPQSMKIIGVLET